jgi:cytochrome c
MNIIHLGIVGATLSLLAGPGAAADEADAMALIEDSRCTKCHAVSREKVGPPFTKVAAKYKDKADALATLTRHVTVPSEVEVDGEKEKHGIAQSQDPARIKNLVEWILSR